MDHDRRPVGELQPDDLEEVACLVGPERQDTRQIGVGLEVDDTRRDQLRAR